MKKKVVATLMASVMCLSMLAACGNTDADAPASSTPSSSTPASGSAEATPAPTEEPKLDFGGQVIEWLVRDDGVKDGQSRYHELKTIAMLEEDLNVDIQFTVISGKGDDALTPILTAGNLPDLMSWKWSNYYSEKGGIPGLYSDGIAMDLTDLIETSIPNLKNIFEQYPNVAKDMKNSAGQYLYLQRINPLESATDIMSSTNTGLIIRQDWLDNVGLEVPTNIAEWYDVLSAFKTMDPNGNGENDELPFDGDGTGIMLFEAAFAMDGQQYIDPATGKVEYGARTQAYKSYLEEMNKWYSEGLICNVFNDDGSAVSGTTEDTIPQDLAGSWKGLANAFGRQTFTGLLEKKPDAAITPCPWPATADGKVYSERTVSSTQDTTILVTTDCDCLDAVAAVINWMYSDEGSLLLTWGEENVTFTYDADGNKILTEEGNAPYELSTGATPQYYKMYGDVSGMFPSLGNFDVNLATRDDWYKESSQVWADASFDIRYPGSITLSAEQAEKVSAANNTSLFEYIAEMKWKFITGQEPLSNFDTYVANLETMGMSDIVKVYQEAYDEYMSR